MTTYPDNDPRRWPRQGAEVDAFYGNPRGKNGNVSPLWVHENLTTVAVPWKLYYAGKVIPSKITIHRKAADSLEKVLQKIWDASAHSQAQIDAWGMSDFSGSFNYRAKIGGRTLSMHSYAVAVDFDADRNGFGDRTPHFAGAQPVLDAFKSQGWIWGGTWSKPDGMHWQAARVR